MSSETSLPRARFHAPHVEPFDRRPPLGRWLREIRRNMLTMIPASAYRDPVVTQKIGPIRWHVLSSPEAFRHVFSDHLDSYPKAPIMHRMLSPYLGRSLFMAEGQEWRAQRQALGPAFRPSALRAMTAQMLRVAQITAGRLARLGAEDESVPISFQMRVLATEMVRHTMFRDLATELSADETPPGAPDPDQLGKYRADQQQNLDQFLQSFGRPGVAELLDLPTWLMPWRAKTPPTAQAGALIDRLIDQRRASGQRRGDMLDMLLDLRIPETGQPMPDDEIRGNLLTFIITGSDTTALALTWSIYVLSQTPEWAARLREEADLAFGSNMDLSCTDALPLTRLFLAEVLRLFPSAPLLMRKARADDRICGAQVRKGDLVLAPIYTLHRHPAVWEDPHLFDPGRFLDPKVKSGHRYLPFGAGPRTCIGAGFALAEARLSLATFVHQLDFALEPGWDVQPLMMLTLKPDGGLPMRVRRRSSERSEPARPRTCTQSSVLAE